jgi:D-serine deaminase-like pyridoxal phosphate-dependent protein
MRAFLPNFLSSVDTPCVVVDLDVVESNLVAAQKILDAAGLQARPHIKTHQIPALALHQIEVGAIGINCQKISEAEVFADAGCRDILIPYNILGPTKLARLKILADRIKVSVAADSLTTIAGLSEWFKDASDPLPVLVECDTGQHRCGVRTPAEVLQLARAIYDVPGLRFEGLMTYPPKAKEAEVNAWLSAARDICTAAGLPPTVISNGGTPGLADAGLVDCATEYRAGTYIYNDRSLAEKSIVSWDDCALKVATMVVSRPEPDLAIIDAGSKILTSDPMGLEGFGYCPEYPAAKVVRLNEEHGYLNLAGLTGPRPEVGEAISVIPNHACVVSNMVDFVFPHRAEKAEAPIRVSGRGLLA